ncbi:hypothetical protein H2200_001797 [Cladophialophora chaetospira]|uniref:Uncharacterized protein n=1 Tax=Cladophialophora chaetospira TaxID=386627 RepID=A0AA38XLV4_9EURO|nr:hypothetical protein H2200_001797 [Cladophialophora chaetospira]
MPRKRSPREPTTNFHMSTRSRNARLTTPEPPNPSTDDSSLSELGTPPATPPSIPSSASRKPISTQASLDDDESPSKSRRSRRKRFAPAKLPDPVQPRKRRGRPPKTKSIDASSTSNPNSSSPAALPEPAEPQKRKGRPRKSRPNDASPESNLKSSSPSIEPLSTAQDSADSSSAPQDSVDSTSRTLRSDSLEALPDTDDQPETQPEGNILETSTLPRRSLRNAQPSIVPLVPAITATQNQIASSANSTTKAEPSTSRKRKSADSSADDTETAPKRKRVGQTAKEPATPQHSEWKDRELWPEFNKDNLTYYANDGATQYHPGEGDESPESRSPSKPTRGGGRGGWRGGRGGTRGGNRGGRRGIPNGKGGRGGSPDPPERRQPLTQEEKGMISILKARQQELKRFFNTVGTHQLDILEQIASRDLNKLAKKASAHKKVPEYDMIVDELQAARQDAEDLARKRYDAEVENENRKYEAEKEVLEQQNKALKAHSRKEHLAGAEGDIILFERAYRAAHDDMHTESGSDMMDYFPHYHELPEPDTQPRGYSSLKIRDEKAFKLQLGESFDEQARQQVLNEDVIGPLLKQIEERNQEWRAEQQHKKSQTMDALSEEAAKELAKIDGYLVPRPLDMGEANSYALSALADVSEWVAQRHPQKQFIYVPLARGDTFPAQGLDFSPLPGQAPPPPPPPPQQAFQQVIRTGSGRRGRRLKYPPLTYEQAVRAATSAPPALATLQPQPQGPPFTPTTPPSGGPPPFDNRGVVSSGPGQIIAPAPPKASPAPPRPNVNIFRHNTKYPPPPPPLPPSQQQSQPQTPTHTRHNSLTQASPNGPGPSPQQNHPQHFIFQTPQQPYQHQAVQHAPPANTAPQQYDPSPAPAAPPPGTPTAASPSHGAVIGQQTKIPMTFVNQTIESRNAAAATVQGGGNGANTPVNSEKGQVKRVLLPKGY